MNHTFRISSLAILWLCFLAGTPLPAQLPQDVRDVFQAMLSDLDDDLATNFRAAIEKDSATVEFTPEQFRRFRDNPINPFDGLDGIDAADGSGNIALKFELPSMRNRTIDPNERQHTSVRKKLRGTTQSAAASTARVFLGERQVALGTIVDADGLIVTKASEVVGETEIVCQLPDNRKLSANILRVDKTNDIALLSVDAQGLTPIDWSTKQPLLGTFVLTPDSSGKVLAVGTYSTRPRSTAAGEQAFLGVQPQTATRGVLISDVRPGNASYEAGLRDGDTILKLGGAPINDVAELVRQIRKRRPGDSVPIEFQRNGSVDTVTAKLAAKNMSGERAARFKMMNRLGAVPSRRGDGFPSVFQHDTPLFPEQCGGPIVDLEGNVLGINIARNGRAASYAIPAAHVQTLLTELQRSNVAALNSQDAPVPN